MERLQKIMARAGIASRRASETFIEEGRVRVNGKVATLGDKADPYKDTITVDGRKIDAPEPMLYVALNKPRNVISAAKSPDPRPTVLDIVPFEERLYPVGRLDIESEGLILLTNDGELTHRLTHPRYKCEKVYKVLVGTEPEAKQLDIWRRGVVLEDGYRTAPVKLKVESITPKGTWLNVTMHEGRKRQIREVGATIGLPVFRIIRQSIGTLKLGKLKPKQWRELTHGEVRDLRKLVGLAAGPAPRKPRSADRSSGRNRPKRSSSPPRRRKR